MGKNNERKKIHPELEIFEAGMINNAKMLIEEGYITPPFSFAFLECLLELWRNKYNEGEINI